MVNKPGLTFRDVYMTHKVYMYTFAFSSLEIERGKLKRNSKQDLKEKFLVTAFNKNDCQHCKIKVSCYPTFTF